jgi:hypothetical protein
VGASLVTQPHEPIPGCGSGVMLEMRPHRKKSIACMRGVLLGAVEGNGRWWNAGSALRVMMRSTIDRWRPVGIARVHF